MKRARRMDHAGPTAIVVVVVTIAIGADSKVARDAGLFDISIDHYDATVESFSGVYWMVTVNASNTRAGSAR